MEIQTKHSVGDRVSFVSNYEKRPEYSKGKIVGISVRVNGKSISTNYYIEQSKTKMILQRIERKVLSKLKQ